LKVNFLRPDSRPRLQTKTILGQKI
jgi:hypothetical protein